MTYPDSLRDYVWRQTLTPDKAAFAELDADGAVVATGGSVHLFGDSFPDVGSRIEDTLPFMTGLLPVDGDPLVLEKMATGAGKHVDLHLVPDSGAYFLLLLDVTEAVRRETDFQQRANELALIRRDQGLTGADLRDLLRVLDVLAVTPGEGNRLLPIGRLPKWAGRFVLLLDSPFDDWSDDTALAYLQSFLGEVWEFWATQKKGVVRSGIWLHAEGDGTEYAYEAAAVNTGVRSILLVTRNPQSSIDTQTMIQKGRDLALSHQELKRRSNDLKKAKDHLEDSVRDRTRELEETNARLTNALRRRAELENERAAIIEQAQRSQRIEALGTLAGGIAHDFNNVLAAIVGYAETGLDSVPSGSDTQTSFSAIMEAAGRAQQLVRQILAMSRQAETKTCSVRMKDVVDEVYRLIRATLPTTIEIQSDLQTDGLVEGDATQIHQVVANLCTNAGQAMKKDGGILRLVLREVELGESDLEVHPDLRPGRYAVLEVRDSGEGIPEATLPKVFDPFFTTKGPGEGTGIGLSVVYGIVASAGGTVTVESEVGEGSTFRVLWPLTTRKAATEPSQKETEVGGHETILFVDDEPMQADLARKMLGKMGYEVLAFTDSRKAFEEFKADPQGVDLLITDLTMPGMTGADLSTEVLKIRPDIPVFVYSGFVEQETEAELFEAGIRRYLLKPILWRQIAEAFREELDNVKGAKA